MTTPKSTKKPATKKPVAKKAAKKKPVAKTMAEPKPKPVDVGGRPTLYKPEYNDQAFKLCLLGATDKEMADFFGVDERTVNNWKESHPTFFQSVKAGKEEADAKVASSLYSRAIGYVGKKTVTANVAGVISDVKVVDEYVGPDVTAGIFWLKNRQRDKWRDKVEVAGDKDNPIQHNHSGSVDVNLTAEEAYKKMLG